MDISNLRERRGSEFTVSELNAYIKGMFDRDTVLRAVTIHGEISNFTNRGHLYFSLKDEESQIKAVMFRSSAQSLKFIPENGMKVIVRCSVSVYSVSGTYQLYVTSMQPDGIGALYLAYEQLKEKLYAEGLFAQEHKQPIPKYPSKIGVITSPVGAAIQDIINICGRRFPLADIYLYPSLVQGDGAPANLIAGIDYFDKTGLVDVIIIGRGGGSIEDLWAFNSEALARQIFSCKIPVISAVGHETDFTICDFVADMRAPTPSAAAELALPDYKDLILRIDSLSEYCASALIRRVEREEMKLDRIKNNSIFKKPSVIFEGLENKLGEHKSSIKQRVDARIGEIESAYRINIGKLEALNPLSVLSRGYSVVSCQNGVIKSVADARVGEEYKIRVSDGTITAEVKDVKKISNKRKENSL